MLVAAAPVAVTANPPLVVSADNASAQLGTLLMAVTVEATSVVLAALAALRIRPSTFHAADAVPPAFCCRATIMPVKAKALLFGRII